jgi:hypothetical protein
MQLYSWMPAIPGLRPRFSFSKRAISGRAEVLPEDIRKAPFVHAVLLAEKLHPLLRKEVFELLNECAKARGWPVDFSHEDFEPYKIAMLSHAAQTSQMTSGTL